MQVSGSKQHTIALLNFHVLREVTKLDISISVWISIRRGGGGLA